MSELTDSLRAHGQRHLGTDLGGLLQWAALHIDAQDEALIRQLVEALEKADKISGYPNNRKTITAGRARLEGMP